MALALAAVTCACQGEPTTSDKATVDDLRLRVEALEKRQADLADELRKSEAKIAAAAAMRPPAQERATYELDRTGKPPVDYPSKQRCEAARQVVLTEIARNSERARAQGAVFVSEPSVVCIPL